MRKLIALCFNHDLNHTINYILTRVIYSIFKVFGIFLTSTEKGNPILFPYLSSKIELKAKKCTYRDAYNVVASNVYIGHKSLPTTSNSHS